MHSIAAFFGARIGRGGLLRILQTLVCAGLLVALHVLLLPQYIALACVSLMVALYTITSSELTARQVAKRMTRAFILGAVISFAVLIWLPHTLWAYLLAVFLASLLTSIATKGNFIALPLVVLNILFFSYASPASYLFLALLVIGEALLGGLLGALNLRVSDALAKRASAEATSPRTIPALQKPPPAPPPKQPGIGRAIVHLFKTLDMRFYKVMVAALLSCLVYLVLGSFMEVLYPIFIYNAVFIVAQATTSGTRKSGFKRLAGILIGAAIGTLLFAFFGALPWYLLLIPLGVALAVTVDYLIFKAYYNTTIIMVFLLMVHSTGGSATGLRYVVSRVVLNAAGILIILLVELLFGWVEHRRRHTPQAKARQVDARVPEDASLAAPPAKAPPQ